MRHSSSITFAGLAAVALASTTASAVTIYSQNFESPVTVGSAGPTALGGFGQPSNNIQGSGYQIQGGGGGPGPSDTYGVDTNGVGGSQALFVGSDNSAATDFTYQQLTTYGSVAAPGAGTPLSAVQVKVALFIAGSEGGNTPIGINFQNNGSDFVFTPTLANNVFTNVTFTLNQATGPAASFNPTLSSNLRFQYGAGGFNFDAGNVVRIDNIVIQTVPEPTTLAALGGLASMALRRRRIAI